MGSKFFSYLKKGLFSVHELLPATHRNSTRIWRVHHPIIPHFAFLLSFRFRPATITSKHPFYSSIRLNHHQQLFLNHLSKPIGETTNSQPITLPTKNWPVKPDPFPLEVATSNPHLRQTTTTKISRPNTSLLNHHFFSQEQPPNNPKLVWKQPSYKNHKQVIS